eukprot:TRINITY_DN39913_c0_g1_i2.p1 TRINITY_DN39913_c0_g1~~TRINITY_DN39913_c0_g1_i2.p1  ORF type:complete len:353 (-),score=61.75 TRINITY_DN39913_c0_g1_i2:63-1121(-)
MRLLAATCLALAAVVGAAFQAVEPSAFLAPSALETGASGRRFISVADLHGDYEHAAALLQRLGLMDKAGNWTGGKDVLVQTGDVCDRGDHSKKIYEMLFQLQDQAPGSGGEVVLLLGNHELMAMQGDTRYATEADMEEFGGEEARANAFGPTGWLGKRLREKNKLVALLGPDHGLKTPTVYVHGGLNANTLAALRTDPSSFVEARTQSESMRFQAGLHLTDSLNARGRSVLKDKDSSELQGSSSELFGDNGPLWTRHLALDKGICGDLSHTLQLLGAERMVVGHTAQEDGVVHSRCDGRLILADTMISAAYTGTSHPSAFEVSPSGESTALYPTSQGLNEKQPQQSEDNAAM